MQFTLPSPAKINHFLHIIGKREDGYHQLQTLFQFLDYGDQLAFETREDDQIILHPHTPMGIPYETNLIVRAAKALQVAANIKKGITISIEKILPFGAGLGGGSSNAATTLIALNECWGLHWSKQQLMEVGVKLGADIPIFIFGHSAWGEGIGEKLTKAQLPEDWFLVITPPTPVITAKMFGDPELTRNTPPFRIGTLVEGEIKNFLTTLRNDFEPLARRDYPEVDETMKWLSNFGKAQLSGSGSSVFICFASLAEAEKVKKQLPPHFEGFIARGTNQSPLIQAAEKLSFKF